MVIHVSESAGAVLTGITCVDSFVSEKCSVGTFAAGRVMLEANALHASSHVQWRVLIRTVPNVAIIR